MTILQRTSFFVQWLEMHRTSLKSLMRHNFVNVLMSLIVAFGTNLANAPHLAAQGQSGGQSYERRFVQANDAYKNADYKRATQMYEQLVQGGIEAAEVYFNLGNCYYKSGKMAAAILNYTRAQRLDPTDDDIEFNLSLAESRIVDKIDPAPQFFIIKWWRLFVGLQTASAWSAAGAGFVWLLCSVAGIFFIANSPRLKKTMFTSGIVSLCGIALMFTFAYQQHKTTVRDESGIVFASSVSVKSEPQEESKDLFVIHEGTRVEILSGDGVWYKVRIADGSVGWLRRNVIQVI
jgi:Tetratricopeptide repeat/Bacterial SH3 domain